MRQVRIGPLTNIVQYDDAEFANAIETDQPMKVGAPVGLDDAVRLADIGSGLTQSITVVTDVVGPTMAVLHFTNGLLTLIT